MDRVDYRESRGAGWARHRAQQLYDGEDYCLYLDAHHRFEPGWDGTLVTMLGSLDCDRPVLTAYPPLYDPATGDRVCGNTPNTIELIGFNGWGCPCWEPGAIHDYHAREQPPNPTRGPPTRVEPRDVLAHIDLSGTSFEPEQRHTCWRLTLRDPLGVERRHVELPAAAITQILAEVPRGFVVHYRTPVRGGRWSLAARVEGRGWLEPVEGEL